MSITAASSILSHTGGAPWQAIPWSDYRRTSRIPMLITVLLLVHQKVITRIDSFSTSMPFRMTDPSLNRRGALSTRACATPPITPHRRITWNSGKGCPRNRPKRLERPERPANSRIQPWKFGLARWRADNLGADNLILDGCPTCFLLFADNVFENMIHLFQSASVCLGHKKE